MTDTGAGDGDGGATPAKLVCPACEATYADCWRCTCGSPLELERGAWERPQDAAEPSVAGPSPETFAPDPRDGLWAFAPLLRVTPTPRVTLGEGYTPLVDAPEWAASFKLDYVFPTGSFKDRGATTLLSRAAGLGVDRVVEDSSGNAGAAVATYAARAGIDCSIYVPADVKASKLRAMERAGASVERVEGSREDVTAACVGAVERGDGWYASHAWNPAFFEGTATMAMEVAHQRGWSVPDAVVLPLGHGTMFLGASLGFERLVAAGLTDEVPRLLGVQAKGYDPIARAVRGDTGDPERDDPLDDPNELADGIQIREPVRGAQILAAIEATDGDCIALGEKPVAAELDALGRAGFDTEPTCAVAPAGLRAYRERGVVSEDDDVVVALSGSGLKT